MFKKLSLPVFAILSALGCSIANENTIEAAKYEAIIDTIYDNEIKPEIIDISKTGNLVSLYLANGSIVMLAENDTDNIILQTRTGPNVINLSTMTNHTEKQREKQVQSLLEKSDPMYVSEAVGAYKGTISIAEDPQCYYCKAFLKEEVPKLIEAGYRIEHYPFAVFPGSLSMMKATACSKEPAKTYKMLSTVSEGFNNHIEAAIEEAGIDPMSIDSNEQAMNYLTEKFISESKVPMKWKCEYPVESISIAFKGLGMTGTPLIVMPDNTLIRGKISADKIIGN